jgi:hypothetical protein
LPTYRVFGRKYQDYYIIVSAANEYEAADIANARPEIDWSTVEMDDVIEATDVFLDDDTSADLQLNNDTDDYPSMENEILIGGTN